MTPENASRVDLSDFYTQVDDTYHALRAFNFLLEHTFEVGTISGTIAYGVNQLLRRQLDDLEDIRGGVSELLDRVKIAERGTAVSDPGQLAQLLARNGYRVMSEAEHAAFVADRFRAVLAEHGDGIATPEPQPEAEAEPAADALDRLRGADLGQIARDTNLKEETVKRVVERLLADPDDAATALRKAQ